MGGDESVISVAPEPTMGYHSCVTGVLTDGREPASGHCQMGSLTGAVASERVTEAFKGWLSMDGNHAIECKRVSQPNCETDRSNSNESWS